MPQVVCVNGMQEVGEITPFPPGLIRYRTGDQGEKTGVYVAGLAQDLCGCYEQ